MQRALKSRFRVSKDAKLKAVNVIIDTVTVTKDLVQIEPVKAALSALAGLLTLLKVLPHLITQDISLILFVEENDAKHGGFTRNRGPLQAYN